MAFGEVSHGNFIGLIIATHFGLYMTVSATSLPKHPGVADLRYLVSMRCLAITPDAVGHDREKERVAGQYCLDGNELLAHVT
jgi:hypothetical protein